MPTFCTTINDLVATTPFPEQKTTKTHAPGLVMAAHNTGLVPLRVVADARLSSGWLFPGQIVLVRAASSSSPWAKEIVRSDHFGEAGKDGVIFVPSTAILAVQRTESTE